jgi:hypothetical protein
MILAKFDDFTAAAGRVVTGPMTKYNRKGVGVILDTGASRTVAPTPLRQAYRGTSTRIGEKPMATNIDKAIYVESLGELIRPRHRQGIGGHGGHDVHAAFAQSG